MLARVALVLHMLVWHQHIAQKPEASLVLSFRAGLADANSSGHDTFASGYEALLANVLSVPTSQAELQSLQTGTAPASVPARRRLLTSQVHIL